MLTLRDSIDRSRAHCSPFEVWCITRFDRNDATLEIYWSERTIPGANTSLTLGPSLTLGGGITTRSYGGHAECMMVRDFARAVSDYGRNPQRVEIFLSRSPCNVSPPFAFAGINYPQGCARKLETLINNNPAVNFWDIRYDDIYWGNPLQVPVPESDILSGSVEGIQVLGLLANVSIHRFNELDLVP